MVDRMNQSLTVVLLSLSGLLFAQRPLLAEEYAPGVVVDAAALADYYRGDEEGFSEHGTIVLSVLKREVVAVSDPIVGDVVGPEVKFPFQQGSFPVALAYPVNVSQWASEIGDGVDLDEWSKRLSKMIPHPKATVVVYGGGVTPTAARAWWILKYLGVEDVRVFNGNAEEWANVEEAWVEKRQQEMLRCMQMPVPPRVEVRVQTAAQRRVTGDALRAKLSAGKEPKLIDARSEREYAAGCVPGAKRLEWSELVDAKSGKLLPAEALREKFASLGVDPKEPTISYCRTGGRASVTVLALAALGSERAANYYGSWSEWQTSGAAQQTKETGR